MTYVFVCAVSQRFPTISPFSQTRFDYYSFS